MKKLILTVAVATMIAGVVFVACQKEVTKTDKKEVIKQGVKQQKMGIPTIIEQPEDPINEVPNVLYSHDGVNFFDENGEIVTGIQVIYGELCASGETRRDEDGHEHIAYCDGEGNNCGDALIMHDNGFHQAAYYLIREDGTIITQPREFC